jgi:hypothetical protein
MQGLVSQNDSRSRYRCACSDIEVLVFNFKHLVANIPYAGPIDTSTRLP